MELELAFDCQNFGALPYAGGLLDQPVGLMRRLRVAKNVFETVMGWKETSGDVEAWNKSNPNGIKLISWIAKLRANNVKQS
jgi:hypothetical protein